MYAHTSHKNHGTGQRTTCGIPPTSWIPGTELRSPSLGESTYISLATSKAFEQSPESNWEPWPVGEVETAAGTEHPVFAPMCLRHRATNHPWLLPVPSQEPQARSRKWLEPNQVIRLTAQGDHPQDDQFGNLGKRGRPGQDLKANHALLIKSFPLAR